MKENILKRNTPVELFQIFFDETLIQHILNETNRYQFQNTHTCELSYERLERRNNQ